MAEGRFFSSAVHSAMDEALGSLASCPRRLPAGLRLRRALSADVPSILELVRGLATFEQEPHAVEMTEETLMRDGFGPEPLFFTLLAEREGADGSRRAVGFGLFVFMYSTWKGRSLFLEDLFIVEEERGHGIGKQVFIVLSRIAKLLDCARLQWLVLDWNAPAKAFYEESVGAELQDDWRLMRMDRAGIARLAEGTFLR